MTQLGMVRYGPISQYLIQSLNSTMRTIVGSHKWGLVPDSDTFFDQDMHRLREKYAEGREWIDEPYILKAGQVSFHHGLCFHGSGPNKTSQPRLSIVAHLMPGDCAYRKSQQWHSNLRYLGPTVRGGFIQRGLFSAALADKEIMRRRLEIRCGRLSSREVDHV